MKKFVNLKLKKIFIKLKLIIMKIKKIIPLVFIIALLFGSCKKKEKIEIKKDPYLENFKELVTLAIKGDEDANSKLTNLIDITKEIHKPQKVVIDSIQLNSATFFYVILQYSEPGYSRFALYSKNLKLFLLDKSLNGEIIFTPVIKGNRKFIAIDESYISKNIFVVRRFSLYTDFKNYIPLVFRTFLSFTRPEGNITQEIKLTRDTIYAKIKPSPEMIKRGFNPKDTIDYFIFDFAKMKYISKYDIMQKWIIKEINLKSDNIAK